MEQAAVPEEVAAALHTWAGGAAADGGPAPEDLGGIEVVADAAPALAVSPWFPYLVNVAGHNATSTDSGVNEPAKRIDAAVLDGFRDQPRPSAYASAIARLLELPWLAARLDRKLEHTLLERVKCGMEAGASPTEDGTGCIALEALVHLVAVKIFKPYKLLEFCRDLLDDMDSEPSELKRRLPRLVGILREHFVEDDLVALLNRLTEEPSAESDARFELALHQLHSALQSNDFQSMIDGLAEARRGFATVARHDEPRHDADAYAAAIDAIMAFNRRDPEPVRAASGRLREAVSHHAAWVSGCYNPPWITNRRQEEHAWYRLSVFLSNAVAPLVDDAWYRVDEAIGALLDAYRASRNFTGPARVNNGVAVLVQPVVEATFIENARNLSLLDRALATDPRFQNDETARQLSDAVHRAVENAHYQKSRSDGGDGSGKDLRRVPAILHYFGANKAQEFLAALPEDLQLTLENVLYDKQIARTEFSNPKTESLLEQLKAELVASPDWQLAGGPFYVLVCETVHFLQRCYNIGRTTGGTRTAYLHAMRSGEGAPKEQLLQSDYLDWLKGGPYYNAVRTEMPDVGAGRADIVVDLTNVSFYIECKRELMDASRDGLHKYVGQTRAYSVTNVAFGILLVLDLTPRLEGVPDLYSSVWIERVQASAEETSRSIVVVRVPGSKPIPSQTASPNRIEQRKQA